MAGSSAKLGGRRSVAEPGGQLGMTTVSGADGLRPDRRRLNPVTSVVSAAARSAASSSSVALAATAAENVEIARVRGRARTGERFSPRSAPRARALLQPDDSN